MLCYSLQASSLLQIEITFLVSKTLVWLVFSFSFPFYQYSLRLT